MVGTAQRCGVLLWPQRSPTGASDTRRDGGPCADSTTGLYNNDTAGESCVSGSLSVHTQEKEEQGHGVRPLPQGKGRSHCDSAVAVTTHNPPCKKQKQTHTVPVTHTQTDTTQWYTHHIGQNGLAQNGSANRNGQTTNH